MSADASPGAGAADGALEWAEGIPPYRLASSWRELDDRLLEAVPDLARRISGVVDTMMATGRALAEKEHARLLAEHPGLRAQLAPSLGRRVLAGLAVAASAMSISLLLSRAQLDPIEVAMPAAALSLLGVVLLSLSVVPFSRSRPPSAMAVRIGVLCLIAPGVSLGVPLAAGALEIPAAQGALVTAALAGAAALTIVLLLLRARTTTAAGHRSEADGAVEATTARLAVERARIVAEARAAVRAAESALPSEARELVSARLRAALGVLGERGLVADPDAHDLVVGDLTIDSELERLSLTMTLGSTVPAELRRAPQAG